MPPSEIEIYSKAKEIKKQNPKFTWSQAYGELEQKFDKDKHDSIERKIRNEKK